VSAGGAVSGDGGASATSGSGGAPSGGRPCSAPPVAEVATFPVVAELPDPFKFSDGTRMTAPSDWERRRTEIGGLVQRFQYGSYPPAPTNVTAAFDGTTLTVTVEYNGNTISYSPVVALPSGTGPFPALVTLGFRDSSTDSSTPVLKGMIPNQTLTDRGIASIIYDPTEISKDGAGYRGQGKFYDLYGATFKAGAIMAWAWGVHRIVDALGTLPQFDATKVAVHGFSRYGKGALVTGAFDTRIALTIASSSGAGGVGSWRSAEAAMAAMTDGGSVQTLSQAADEANWFVSDFKPNFGCRVQQLPFDGHSVVVLVAPRPILVTEGRLDSWNNPPGCFNSVLAARKVFTYLDKGDYLGFKSSEAYHEFTAEQQTAALTFMDRFLLGSTTADTNIFSNSFKPDPTAAPWSTP
jgi:hypothetical protein